MRFESELELRDKKWIDRLTELPEKGMGFQVVDITLTDGTTVRHVFVFGCERIMFTPESRKFVENEIVTIENSQD